MIRYSVYSIHWDISGGNTIRFVYDYDTPQEAYAAIEEMAGDFTVIRENWDD